MPLMLIDGQQDKAAIAVLKEVLRGGDKTVALQAAAVLYAKEQTAQSMLKILGYM